MKKREIAKHMGKKHKLLLVPSERYKDSEYLFKNPKVPKNVMGFINRKQRFTAPNDLDVDSPFKAKQILWM